MLTALGGTKDKVSGFNSGADDYLTKPFDLGQARVSAASTQRQSAGRLRQPPRILNTDLTLV